MPKILQRTSRLRFERLNEDPQIMIYTDQTYPVRNLPDFRVEIFQNITTDRFEILQAELPDAARQYPSGFLQPTSQSMLCSSSDSITTSSITQQAHPTIAYPALASRSKGEDRSAAAFETTAHATLDASRSTLLAVAPAVNQSRDDSPRQPDSAAETSKPADAAASPAPLSEAAGACIEEAAFSDPSDAAAAARCDPSDAAAAACFVCLDATADAVLLECGHGGLCGGCGDALWRRGPAHRDCPMCRAAFTAVMRILSADGDEVHHTHTLTHTTTTTTTPPSHRHHRSTYR